eukprot:m.91263 g.91263  ORF g.91263 m.91263 type:complete len:52 (-) comp51134_c0_seq1:1368-1523(-)
MLRAPVFAHSLLRLIPLVTVRHPCMLVWSLCDLFQSSKLQMNRVDGLLLGG